MGLHVVRAGMLGWMPWTYCMYMDTVWTCITLQKCVLYQFEILPFFAQEGRHRLVLNFIFLGLGDDNANLIITIPNPPSFPPPPHLIPQCSQTICFSLPNYWHRALTTWIITMPKWSKFPIGICDICYQFL